MSASMPRPPRPRGLSGPELPPRAELAAVGELPPEPVKAWSIPRAFGQVEIAVLPPRAAHERHVLAARVRLPSGAFRGANFYTLEEADVIAVAIEFLRGLERPKDATG